MLEQGGQERSSAGRGSSLSKAPEAEKCLEGLGTERSLAGGPRHGRTLGREVGPWAHSVDREPRVSSQGSRKTLYTLGGDHSGLIYSFKRPLKLLYGEWVEGRSQHMLDAVGEGKGGL